MLLHGSVAISMIIVCLAAGALELPDTPKLRLETGQHVDFIRRVQADAAGNWLLTVSSDMTARLWDAHGGRLLRTLHVPQGADTEGSLYAGTINADGQLVALGGYTGERLGNDFGIYLFDPASGELKKRIGGLEAAVSALSFSPDGRTLAATLFSGELLLFRISDGSLLIRNADCKQRSADVAYHPHGNRIATTCFDGSVRLYDTAGHKLLQKTPILGAQPFRLVFSPDGQRIAVGYLDRAAVRLLRAIDLELESTPMFMWPYGDLSEVNWSKDGQTLYAAGSPSDSFGLHSVFAWQQGGRGEPKFIAQMGSDPGGIATLPDGGIAWVSFVPSMGVTEANGRTRWKISATQAMVHDYEYSQSALRISTDGKRVKFYLIWDRAVQFDLNRPGLQTSSSGDDLLPAKTVSQKVQAVIDSDRKLMLNKRLLALDPNERAYSFALTTDERRLLVGTLSTLRCYDPDGKLLWITPTHSQARVVNASRDGRLVVVAYHNGTVSWYRISDGVELLTLYASRDGKQWVAWTPQGYYVANPEGEQLIRWLNRHGRNSAPDFYPAAQMRDRYYRPDVIARVLDTLDPLEALAQADRELERRLALPEVRPDLQQQPPVVTLLAPFDGDRFANPHQTLRLRVQSSAAVTDVRISIDGEPLAASLGLRQHEAGAFEQSINVDLPTRDVELTVIVENLHGVSQPVRARLAWAGMISDTPQLRLQANPHGASIRAFAADAAGKLLLTASRDKTGRLWDAHDGRLLRTLRVPIGSNAEESQLFAAALSPDGRLAALGGFTGQRSTEDFSIYLFDTTTGNLLRRFGNHGGSIQGLKFSPDGHTLASITSSGRLHIYRSSDGQELASDWSCPDAKALAYNPVGDHLVTSCSDGTIRLYTATGQQMHVVKPVDKAMPADVSYSPDGNWLAVGYFDRPIVRILRASDLAPAYTPDITGIDYGDLSKVAWSADGRTLYAAGDYYINTRFPIFVWANAGRGTRRMLSAGRNTISGLVSLPDGLAWSSMDPALGVFTVNSQVRWRADPHTFDPRNGSLLLSADGKRLQFTLDQGLRPVSFDISTMQLKIDPPKNGNLQPARTQGAAFKVTNWQHSFNVRLNGRLLDMGGDTAHSFTLTADKQGFLLGMVWRLSYYDANGTRLWEIPVPSVVWGVNVSSDGRLVVAAYGDGTLRWYRMSDGMELLALCVSRDGHHWVTWTPQGYYVANPGGEQLIGWHVNHGRDSIPDFFTAGQLRQRYYRPDVITRVLDALDPLEALRLADQAAGRRMPANATTAAAPSPQQLPPVVTLLAPNDNTRFEHTAQTLRLRIQSPVEISSVRVLVDGRPLPSTKGLERINTGESERTIDVELPARDLELAVIAENAFGASQPARTRLIWAADNLSEFVAKPKLYVLAVGVGKFAHQQLPSLTYPTKDAADFAATLKRQEGGLYREVVPRVLPDPDRTAVIDGLTWLRREVTYRDVAMVLLSGHGLIDHDGSYHFLPHDADPERLDSSAIPDSLITKITKSLPGKILIFLDTCHAGALDGTARRSADADRLAIELSQAENGVIVFTASTGRGYAQEDPAWGNGAFTKAVLEGINGQADYHKDGRITVNMLDLYIAERVKALTHGAQIPTTAKPSTVPDFPIALRR